MPGGRVPRRHRRAADRLAVIDNVDGAGGRADATCGSHQGQKAGLRAEQGDHAYLGGKQPAPLFDEDVKGA